MKTKTRDFLPTKMDREVRVALEEAGAAFEEAIDPWEDQTYVKLPDGWYIRMAQSSPWSCELVDKDGRVRAFTGNRSDGKSYLFFRRS